MAQELPGWINYWNDIAPRLESHIESSRVLEAETFLTAVFSYYSFCTEDLSKKVQKHKADAKSVFPMIIQIQDMLRSNIFNQQHLLMASGAFNLRVAFEIRVNLLFIYEHEDPAKMLKRMLAFVQYEKLMGRKETPGHTPPSPEEEKAFVALHPYWENRKQPGTLKKGAKWNGEGKSMRGMCEFLLEKDPEKFKTMVDDYYYVYSNTSIFIHGSPAARELYSHPLLGFNPIGSPRRVMMMTLRSTYFMLRLLEEFMIFFGVGHKESDLRLLSRMFNEANAAYKRAK